MGYVETLPSGRYRGVPWNAAAGKRGRSASFDRWAEADAYWRRIEREIDGDYQGADIAVIRQQRGIPRFAEHVIAWAKLGIEDGELATVRSYQSQARSLAAQWPTQRVDEITPLMVKGYLAELRAAGTSPSTRTLRLTVLRHAMRRHRRRVPGRRSDAGGQGAQAAGTPGPHPHRAGAVSDAARRA